MAKYMDRVVIFFPRREIILARREQENFQLIVITHDEKCARLL